MDITTSQAAGTSTTSAALPQSSNRQISSDFETFLRMLTVQMQNQDPLNPIDSSDYAVQLATFSNVEQQVQTNDILRELQSQMGISGIAELSGWVGKEVRVQAPAAFEGAPIMLFPSPDSAATEADIVVRDANGLEVTRFTIPATDDPVEWAGVTDDGFPLPSGSYSFDVESYEGDVLLATSQAAIYAKVAEVQRNETGETFVVLDGGATVSTNAVTAIRESVT